jgi:hypothetical protein
MSQLMPMVLPSAFVVVKNALALGHELVGLGLPYFVVARLKARVRVALLNRQRGRRRRGLLGGARGVQVLAARLRRLRHLPSLARMRPSPFVHQLVAHGLRARARHLLSGL